MHSKDALCIPNMNTMARINQELQAVLKFTYGRNGRRTEEIAHYTVSSMIILSRDIMHANLQISNFEPRFKVRNEKCDGLSIADTHD